MEATKELPDPLLTPHLTGDVEKDKNVAEAGTLEGDVTEGDKEKYKNVAEAGTGEGDVTEGDEEKEKDKNVAEAGTGQGDMTEGDKEKEKDKNVAEAAKGCSAQSAIDVDVDEIESMVDKITILEADVLKDVYGFQGVSELTSFQGDARYQRQDILKHWKEVPKNGYAEIDLLRLKTWCKDSDFHLFLKAQVLMAITSGIMG